MDVANLVLFYLIGINAITFMLMALDKHKAKKHVYRIPERTIWTLAILGGAVGVFLGMRQFRHKTKHRSFTIGVPILILLQAAIFLRFLFSRINGL
ncbi:DUF1294 domain-containing protein [Lentibacillus juripiscarius]|uniref:DUF1294 domain-containing protein n=1 Tax=Lentibacillus juripiscarius TaxID=257446 RepID=A0ABW5V7Z4_9BACI